MISKSYIIASTKSIIEMNINHKGEWAFYLAEKYQKQQHLANMNEPSESKNSIFQIKAIMI